MEATSCSAKILQGRELKIANIVKVQSGKTRQRNLEGTLRNFMQPRTKIKSLLSAQDISLP